jgi:RNA-binding protein
MATRFGPKLPAVIRRLSLPMALSDAQRKHLRRLGHDRNPIVLVGQGGLSANLVAELDRALRDHELVKVRARVGERDERDRILAELASSTSSELVQRIGHVALLYRRNPDQPGILLPD